MNCTCFSTYIRALVAEHRQVARDGFAVEVQAAKLGKVFRKFNVARNLFGATQRQRRRWWGSRQQEGRQKVNA